MLRLSVPGAVQGDARHPANQPAVDQLMHGMTDEIHDAHE
jgi:hypothetical protein